MFGKRLAIGLALALATVGCGTLAISSASADTLYWDSNGTTAGFGNTNGTWGTSAFWSTDSLGETATANTTTTTSDLLYFGTDTLGYTGGRTVTVNGTRDANSLYFGSASGTVTISGGTLNIGGTAPTITVNNSTSTISSVTTGTGFTKTGNGILILNNNSNSYVGPTIVTGGVLQIGTGFNAGNLSVPGGYTGNPVTGSNLELNGGIVSYWFDFARTLGTGDGQIQITGGVSGFTQKQGDRFNLVFGTDGSEIQWGTATFNPTTLILNDSTAVASSPISFNNALDLNGADRTVATNSTAFTNNNNAFGRVIETGALLNYNIRNTDGVNTAALIKTGVGKLALDGTNTYDGGTSINEGGVLFDNVVSMPAIGNVTVNDGTELIVSVGNAGEWTTGTSGVGTLGGLLAGDGGQTAAQVTYSGNVTVGVNTTTNQAYAGDIANVTGSTSTGLSVYADDGSGQLTLAGSNSYTGATKLHDGATLVANSANALGNGGDISFATGGTLTYTAASAGNDFGSRIKNSGSAISLNTNGQDVTLSEIAAGNTGGLTKAGAGTLTFTGNNTYSGATTLSGGTIAVYDGTLTTSGGAVTMVTNTTISVLGGSGVNSTWDVGGQQLGTANNTQNNVQITIDGDGVAGSALVTNVGILNFGRTATNSTLLVTDGGQMNVNGEVRIGNPYYSTAGNATMTIGGGTATSTFSGDGGDDFYIGYGERENSNNNVVTVNSGGVLTNVRNMFVGHVNNQQGNGLPSTANQLTVTGTGTASMTSISVGYAQNAGIVSDLEEANANVVEVTSGGQLTTSATNYIGRANANFTESNANTVTISGTGSTWNAGNQIVYVGHTNNAGAVSNNNTLTVASGGLLTNVNSLVVGFGTGTEIGNQVILNGGTITANSVTVSAGNTMSGSGTVNAPMTVDGTLSPGNSIGTMTIGGELTWNGSASTPWVFELGPGETADLLSIIGGNSFTKGTGTGGTDFVFDFAGGTDTGTFDLVTWTGGSTTFAESDFSYTNLGGGNTGSFQISGSTLQFVAVPEPAALALVACGGAISIALVRRRR